MHETIHTCGLCGSHRAMWTEETTSNTRFVHSHHIMIYIPYRCRYVCAPRTSGFCFASYVYGAHPDLSYIITVLDFPIFHLSLRFKSIKIRYTECITNAHAPFEPKTQPHIQTMNGVQLASQFEWSMCYSFGVG